jgi:hypothetical protein
MSPKISTNESDEFAHKKPVVTGLYSYLDIKSGTEP